MADADLPPFLCGDGRHKVEALDITQALGIRSLGVTKAQGRRLVQMFIKNGASNHSSFGGTLWVILSYCAEKKIPVTIEAHPGLGFRVARVQPQPKGEPT